MQEKLTSDLYQAICNVLEEHDLLSEDFSPSGQATKLMQMADQASCLIAYAACNASKSVERLVGIRG